MAAVSLHHFKRRFHAWWEGYEPPPESAGEIYPDRPEPEMAATPASTVAAAPAALPDSWTESRVAAAQTFWGEGFEGPGGAEAAVAMVAPLGLESGRTLLELGCGLGGAGRALAAALGVHVEGLEPSPTLAAAGGAAAAFDPASAKLPARKFDAVLARHVLARVPEPATFLASLAGALAPAGQLLIVELTPEAAAPGEAPTADAIVASLAAAPLELRSREDLTPAFVGEVRAGLARAAAALERAPPLPDLAPTLARELDLWLRRLESCEAGTLRLTRIHAARVD